MNEREQQGLIKAFEDTVELAWNTLRDLLRSRLEQRLQEDLVLRHELPAELEEHVQRVGRCLWTQP